MIKIMTKTPEELYYLGKRLATFLKPGDLLALDGDLGAGKTTITQGIAQGLGITDVVNSPTFTIIHEYDSGTMRLYHMDVYRLKNVQEMEDLGYEEYFYGQGLTVVEWAKIVNDVLPENYLALEITVCPEGRLVTCKPMGEKYERVIEELTGCDYTKYR